MLFNSYVFILAFLPIVWCLYFGLNKIKCYRCATWVLTLASLVFYGWGNWKFCLILIASIAVNFGLHRMLLGINRGRKTVLILGILYNIGLLFYVKYFDFFLENMNALFGLDLPMKHILLPLGISFYTFQQVSFVIDSYRGGMEKYRFGEYALFVSFFPQLVAGPIVLHQDMIPQFRDESKRKPDVDNIYGGLQYFSLGLAKKVLIADTFGRAVDFGYANYGSMNRISAIVLVIAYTLQIYFDFSGYCDMAIGLGKLFNFEIAMNFNSPYKAKSVGEFWDRWHMTLTRFFTTYVYIPLGGSRKGLVRTCINTVIVFLISGFWHGADWSFVLWGLMHGVMLVLERLFKNVLEKIPGWIRWLYTFCFVNLAWVVFRADYLRQGLSVIRRVILGEGGPVSEGLRDAFSGQGIELLMQQIDPCFTLGEGWKQAVMWLWLVFALVLAIFGKNTHEWVKKNSSSKWYIYGVAALFVISVLCLSEVSQFLYFNF